MVEQACRNNAPDESFARRLGRAIRVFGAKGPARDHIPSPWHTAMRDETRSLLDAGEEGFRVDLALSHSGSGRQRSHAAARLGIRRDERSLRELERMLTDRSARVRRGALTWYAAAIHPGNADRWHGPPEAFEPAGADVPGLARLLARLDDENHNVRLRAVATVGAYLPSGDKRVIRALHKALDDTKHKVRHAAARLLKAPCPGCGRTW